MEKKIRLNHAVIVGLLELFIEDPKVIMFSDKVEVSGTVRAGKYKGMQVMYHYHIDEVLEHIVFQYASKYSYMALNVHSDSWMFAQLVFKKLATQYYIHSNQFDSSCNAPGGCNSCSCSVYDWTATGVTKEA